MEALLNPPELSDETGQIDLDDDQSAPDQEPGDADDDSTGDDSGPSDGDTGSSSGDSSDDTTGDDSGDTSDSDTDDDSEDSSDGDTDDSSGSEDSSDDESDQTDEAENEADDDDPDSQETDNESTIALSSDRPAPGEEVTVTVTDGDGPKSNATVRFNGEQIGTTDADGAINGTVPFTEMVSVEVTSDTGNETATTTFPVASEVTIALEPVPLVLGGEAAVQAHVNGEPVSNADLYLGEEQVGTTDEAGEAVLAVPDDLGREEVTLTARRGEIEDERTVAVGQLEVTPESTTVLAIPGQEISLTATVGSIPVSGVEIVDDGTVVATTGSDGEATVSASFESETLITGSYAGQETTTQVENRFLPVVVGMGVLVTGVLGTGVVLRRRSGRLATARRRIERRVRNSIDACIGTILWLEDALGSTQGRERQALWSLLLRLLQSPLVAMRSLKSALVGLFAIPRWTGGSRGAPRSSAGGPTEEGQTADARDHGPRSSIRQAWASFVRLVLRRIDPTLTPGEVARKAVATGFPTGPVQRITDTFRVVEYGRADPESRLDDATGALTEIEETIPERFASGDDERPADD
ncbi:DUF4129 domain-containing protein [Natronorubrum bangense]|uniref:DUF4129 domain-containing protein n=1 Tax=Natronorubrum bangense TaxID=61858 RepID=UPI0006782228|nr:DUF4129 domain-containing protein [Natronorubrum bangense]